MASGMIRLTSLAPGIVIFLIILKNGFRRFDFHAAIWPTCSDS
jgi:hypothetical protein